MLKRLHSCRLLYASALFIGLMSMSSAEAQIVVPGSYIPERQMEANKEIQVPKSVPKGTDALLPMAVAPENAKTLKFVLKRLVITGNETLDSSSFDDLWHPFIGKEMSVATLYELANSITARYVKEGYALSFAIVPEQKIKDGEAVLRVVEGYIGNVKFTGDRLASLMDSHDDALSQGTIIDVMASGIMDSKPLRMDDLERLMLLLNDMPGVAAKSRLEASKAKDGASELIIDFKRRVFMAEAEVDNRMSKDSRRWSIGGNVAFNGVLYGGDVLRFEAHCARSGCKGSYDGTIKWSTFLGANGLKFSALFSRNESKPVQGFLVPLRFSGEGQKISFSLDYPLLRTRSRSLFVGSGLDFSDSQTKTFAGTLTRDSVRVFDAHLSYDFADYYAASNIFQIKVMQGISGWGATEGNDQLRSRLNGSARFTNAYMGVVRYQPLGAISNFFDKSMLVLEGSGQVAVSHSLLSASQCSYGGAYIGRGYDSGAINGDHCVQGLVEFQHNTNLLSYEMQPYIFADIGRTWVKGRLVGNEVRTQSASSTGVGLRFGQDVSSHILGDLQIALPLKRDYAEGHSNSPRLFFSLRIKF